MASSSPNQVWERWPDMRVLFTSGHAAEVLTQHGLAYLNVPFLAKPYTRDEALAKKNYSPSGRVAVGRGSLLVFPYVLKARKGAITGAS